MFLKRSLNFLWNGQKWKFFLEYTFFLFNPYVQQNFSYSVIPQNVNQFNDRIL